MATHDDNKRAAQQDLLRELRELQNVLNTEAEQIIPVLKDVVGAPPRTKPQHKSTCEIPDSGSRGRAEKDIAVPDPDNDGDSSGDTEQTAEYRRDSDLVRQKEPAKPPPFALVSSRALDYDTSTAESLVEDGLAEALQSLTREMDDEALRLVDELIAEHAAIIRQELSMKLNEKNSELRAQLAANRAGNGQ